MSYKKLKIDGLTKEQVVMLDTMWQLDSIQSFEDWYINLEPYEMRMATELRYILMDAVMESEDIQIIDIKKYLKKFMLTQV